MRGEERHAPFTLAALSEGDASGASFWLGRSGNSSRGPSLALALLILLLPRERVVTGDGREVAALLARLLVRETGSLVIGEKRSMRGFSSTAGFRLRRMHSSRIHRAHQVTTLKRLGKQSHAKPMDLEKLICANESIGCSHKRFYTNLHWRA